MQMTITNPTLADQVSVDEIRSSALPNCSLCETPGVSLHAGLVDRLFGAPGRWALKQCSRAGCGLAWLDPVPLEQDVHKAYANYHTHEDPPAPRLSWLRRIYNFIKLGYLARRYGYRNVGSPSQQALGLLLYLAPTRRAAVDAQYLMLPAQENGSLLDVGCGNGQTMVWMASLGWKVQGIDTDPMAVKVAAFKGFNVRQGQLQSQQFAAGSFDVISMNHVIEHVHNSLSLMKECYRLLKPGGRLIVITPNIRSWGHRLYKNDWRGLEPPRHLQIFARPSLLRLSGLAGFAHCECRAISRTARDILLASRLLKRNQSPTVRPGFAVRLWAETMGVMEWARSYFDRDAGEELFLVAKKETAQKEDV